MKGDSKTLSYLNSVLKQKLTTINQYFLHARMLENWGFETLGKTEYGYSITHMKQSDKLTKRILFLEGIPNLQDLGALRIGENPEEILKGDLVQQGQTVTLLKEAIVHCESCGDYVTRELLVALQEDDEEQIDWLETQAFLMTSLGMENYLQSQI